MPHQIRLAGPWEISTDGDVNWERCQLPFAFPRAITDRRLRRRFHRPTGLEAASTVILRLTGKSLPTTILLNDTPVTVSPSAASAVTPTLTSALQPFNEICIEARADDRAGVVVESVVLEISD